jgi:Flp pilus assembly protein TadB
MTDISPHDDDDIGSRPVPGFGGPTSDERTSDGQSALRLHAGIAVVATVLSAFVTGIFVWLGAIPIAIAFAVVTVACVVTFGWAVRRRRRGARSR